MDRPAPEDSEATHARRRRVLQEVVETEATFVANLNMFVDSYPNFYSSESIFCSCSLRASWASSSDSYLSNSNYFSFNSSFCFKWVLFGIGFGLGR